MSWSTSATSTRAMYGSRWAPSTSARAAQRLMTKLPERLRSDPDAQALAQLNDGCGTGVDVVHLIYRSKDYENDAKDYEFSRWTMREHWSSGYADVLQTLRHPAWRGR